MSLQKTSTIALFLNQGMSRNDPYSRLGESPGTDKGRESSSLVALI